MDPGPVELRGVEEHEVIAICWTRTPHLEKEKSPPGPLWVQDVVHELKYSLEVVLNIKGKNFALLWLS